MKVLHLPGSVGDNAWSLSRAERELGIESDAIFLDEGTIFENHVEFPGKELREGGIIERNKKKIQFYEKAIKKYDVFHFNWGSTAFSWATSFIPPIELGWLKRHGAIIAVTYQGSDARQEDYCLKHFEVTHAMDYTAWELKRAKIASMVKRRHIAAFEKYADIIYATNPDILNVLPSFAKFRPYTKININNVRPVYISNQEGPLRVIHAPTDRKKKGTRYLVEAINRLQREGYEIDLKLIENLKREDATRQYELADVIVDQLVIGWYGGFGMECMAMGKPTICYIRKDDMHFLPNGMADEIPLINASPFSIYERLKDLLENRSQLYDIAHASRRYVETWHDNLKNAASVIDDYNRAISDRNVTK